MRLKFVLFCFWLIPTISSGFILDIQCSRKLNTLKPSKGPTSHTRFIYVYLISNLITPAQPLHCIFTLYLKCIYRYCVLVIPILVTPSRTLCSYLYPQEHHVLSCSVVSDSLRPHELQPGSSVHGIILEEHWSGLPFPPPGNIIGLSNHLQNERMNE